MIVGIYSVHDEKADAYMPPFFVKSDMVAARMFIDGVHAETNAAFRENPEDFELRIIGTFDDESGALTPHPGGPAVILTAQAAIRTRFEQERKRHNDANSKMVRELTSAEEAISGRS